MQADSCPHATFLRREEEATAECSLPTEPAELPTRVRCASARCAGLLVSLLQDCAASIEHLDDAPRAYYTALEHSALLADCIELDQASARGPRGHSRLLPAVILRGCLYLCMYMSSRGGGVLTAPPAANRRRRPSPRSRWGGPGSSVAGRLAFIV